MGFLFGQLEKKSALETRSIGSNRVTLPKRVWDKIKITSSCWIWTGADTGTKRPYGITWNSKRHKREKVHRYVYQAVNGPIADDLVIDHICKNTMCCNPDHLRTVTNRFNILIGDAPGPLAVRTNRCKRGHVFTPENTRIRKFDGGRECRACCRIRNRNRKHLARSERMNNVEAA